MPAGTQRRKLTGTGSFADASFRIRVALRASMIFSVDFGCDGGSRARFEGTRFHFIRASTGSEEDDRERTMTRVIYRSEMARVAEEKMRNSDEEWVYTVRGKSFLRYM